MKLSDIKGERTLEVIAEIIDPVANIAEDAEAMSLFKREKVPEGADVKATLIKRIRQGVPALLKNHKKDIISILATIEGTTAEQYAMGLTLPKLIMDCTELLTDETFAELFISAQSETGDTSFGSAQENIEGI